MMVLTYLINRVQSAGDAGIECEERKKNKNNDDNGNERC